MSGLLSKTVDAFRSAGGASDEQARAAAEDTAEFRSRLLRVEIELNLLNRPGRVDTGRCRLGAARAGLLRVTV